MYLQVKHLTSISSTLHGVGKAEFKITGTSDYLLIKNGSLVAGTRSAGNSKFEFIVEFTYDAFKIFPDCYIAFNATGGIHGLCGLAEGDDETKMSLSTAT